MNRFCSFFARLHLVPATGHSFGQYDRNVGLMRTRIKYLQIVDPPMTYLTEIVLCRSHSITHHSITHHSITHHSITHHSKFCLTGMLSETGGKKGLKTASRSHPHIKYKIGGTIICSAHYKWILSLHFQHWKVLYSHGRLQEIKATLTSVLLNPVNSKKTDDVKGLFKNDGESSSDFSEKLFEVSDTHDSFDGTSVPDSEVKRPLEPHMQKK
ncbi:hypothetical protein PR048_016474 [Dryococelus australis]|uniref:Uncharacterized protein n=1 Tax=Dryococelus australis TaxID=614101 RepID=A0ABQ9HK39_9NEOP|nr:hypothetical protein PR048_016474 [Dryococelus australis]